ACGPFLSCLLPYRLLRHPPSPPFPSTTLFRSVSDVQHRLQRSIPAFQSRGYRTTALSVARKTGGHPPAVTSFTTAGRYSRPNGLDRKSTRLNSSHVSTSYAVFRLKKKHITIAS